MTQPSAQAPSTHWGDDVCTWFGYPCATTHSNIILYTGHYFEVFFGEWINSCFAFIIQINATKPPFQLSTKGQKLNDDNNYYNDDDNNATTMTMTSFFQATTNLGWILSWQRGVINFYNDDNNEVDNDGKNNEDNYEDDKN